MASGDEDSANPATLSDLQERAINAEAETGEIDDTSDLSRSAVLSRARKFLESDNVRGASKERKKAFLEKKGLGDDEIKGLLEEERDSSSSGSKSGSTTNSKLRPPPLPSAPLPTSSTSQAERNTPPIITYPEFLTRRRAPPPLITAQGVLSSLYVTAGASTAIYAASKYVVSPMTDQLTEARHSLADTALSKLALLNEKLESAVSEIPTPQRPTNLDQTDDLARSITSFDSDPRELFHVDMGTQTTPLQSRRPSSSSGGSDLIEDKSKTLAEQTTAISDLKDHIEEIMFENNLSTEQGSARLRASTAELTKYLDGFIHSSPYYSNNAPGGGIGLSKLKASAMNESDAINQAKSEIRSIKGVFLSPRNFPSSAGVGRNGSRTGAQ